MIVCVCNNVSNKTIDKILENKVQSGERIQSVACLQKEMTVCNNCGTCYCELKSMIDKKNGKNIIDTETQLESLFDDLSQFGVN